MTSEEQNLLRKAATDPKGQIAIKRTHPTWHSDRHRLDGLVLQPGFTSAPGALAPVAFAGALLVAPAPGRPVLDRLDGRRALPDQMPQQSPHLRHGEGQQPGGARDGIFSPQWRSGAPPSGTHAPAWIR